MKKWVIIKICIPQKIDELIIPLFAAVLKISGSDKPRCVNVADGRTERRESSTCPMESFDIPFVLQCKRGRGITRHDPVNTSGDWTNIRTGCDCQLMRSSKVCTQPMQKINNDNTHEQRRWRLREIMKRLTHTPAWSSGRSKSWKDPSDFSSRAAVRHNCSRWALVTLPQKQLPLNSES